MDATTGLPRSWGASPDRGASDARERMEVALHLARRAGRPTSLLAVAIDCSVAGEPLADLETRARAAVEERLRAEVGAGGPPLVREGELVHALLAGRDLDAARAIAERLVEEAKHLRVAGSEHDLRIELAIGLARDERAKDYWLATLLAVAAEGVEVSRSLGGERVMHTELYALCQRKAEREGPRPKVVLPPEHASPAPAPAGRPAGSGPRAASPGSRPAGPVPPPAAADPVPREEAQFAAGAAADGAAADPGAGEEEREREHREEVERLERRIAKLMETLAATERELRELALRQSEPTGVASRYREIQGLSAEDERFEVKAALMERILQANLELRRILEAQTQARRG